MEAVNSMLDVNPLMKLESASIRSGQTQIIDRINWNIYPGDTWIISGFHASGKTGLLKAAAGLKKIISGKHTLFGINYWECTDEEMVKIRRQIAFVFEYPSQLMAHLTVGENIAFPICYHENKTLRELDSDVQGLLDYLEIQSISNRYPVEVNIFQKYLLLIGQGLFLKPKLFFIDNPLNGLDPLQKNRIKRLIYQMSSGIEKLGIPPITVIISTSELNNFLVNKPEFINLKYGILTNKEFHIFEGNQKNEMRANSMIKELLGERRES